MGIPTYPSKRFFKAGAKRCTGNWGVAEELGAGDGILITDDGGLALKQTYDPYPAIDQVVLMDGDMGPSEASDFNPPFTLSYNPGRMGSIIAAVFGLAGVPEGLYVIAAGVNDDIDVTEDVTKKVATVPPGIYTGTELAAAIEAALELAGEFTYTCTYAASTNTFTIGVSASSTFLWITGDNHETSIALTCGYTADEAPGTGPFISDQAGAGTAKKHVFRWADAVEKFFTFAETKPGTIWEVPSAMPYKLNLKLGDGKVQGVISLRGNTLLDDSDPAIVNTETEMALVDYVERGKRVQFQNGYFWMNEEDDGVLSGTDAIIPSDMDITWERLPDAQQVAGGTFIALPIEGPAPKFAVKITIPRASAGNIDLAAFKAMIAQKMEFGFTSPALAVAGIHYSWKFFFPRLKYIEPPASAYEDVMKAVLTFVGEESAAAPDGMDDTRPYAELVNLIGTDYLA